MSAKVKLLVKTGAQIRAGTDANVQVILEDVEGVKIPSYTLDLPLHDDLERGTLDVYTLSIPVNFSFVHKIYLTRDRKGYSDDWFCDYMIVQDFRGSQPRKIKNPNAPGILTEKNNGHNAEYYFPICRWIHAEHIYEFRPFATCLPSYDPTPEAREKDIQHKRKMYEYTQHGEGTPAQVCICLIFLK